MGKKPDIKRFLIKFRKKFPEYDLVSKTDFNWVRPIGVICPRHGEFKKFANDLIRGSGCPRCAGRHRTTDDFIREAQKIHGDKYNYNEVIYNQAKDKVKIICPEHGIFEQKAIAHLRGHACPMCAGVVRKTNQEFVKRAKEIHGGKYDYSNVNYRNSKNKVKIVCSEHGAFEQRPADHLKGNGCPKCGGTEFLTNLVFKKKAGEIHNNKYDYTNSDYKGAFVKIKITCPEHGVFEQIPNNHLMGRGCPECSASGFNPNKPAILYYIKDKESNLYKIGITGKVLEERFGKDFISKRIEILLEETYENGQKAYLAEQEILTAFNNYRCVNDNWPEDKGGKTEFFNRDVLEIDKKEYK